MSSLVVVLQAITSLLILACFDLTFTEYFIPHTSLRLAKVGMVNSTHAKIFARFPGTHPIALHYKPDDSSKLMKTVFKTTLKENDYSAQFVLDGLSPDTEYQVTFTINDTAVLNNLSFKTFPKESKAFKFLYSSCVKPNFPYGVRDIVGFREMSKQNADFVMFLGDLVYVDYPRYFGDDLETYRAHYRRVFQHSDSRALFSSTPSFFVYDDHEIMNDWDKTDQHPFATALQAFNEYAGFGNPELLDKTVNGGIHYHFDYGTVATFFVMDTRRYRSSQNQTMLGPQQLKEFKRWLHEKKDFKFKFMVSSVPFTFNFKVNGKDTWRDYRKERTEILSFIKENDIKNVIGLSGDRHEVAITKLDGHILEFSTSPVLQFYSPIDTYEEEDADEKVFTWRVGHVKWASIEIDSDQNGHYLKYSLFVNDISKTPVYELIYYENGDIKQEYK